MISVAEALKHITDLCHRLEPEDLPLSQAAGRVLAQDVAAGRDQPPFAASAMDGYAVRNADVTPGATLTVIGESAAGSRFSGMLGTGQAVRIFTGAPVPENADRVIIQEDTTKAGAQITLRDKLDTSTYIRPSGFDFKLGDRMTAPRRLSASDVALLASMNVKTVPVARRPIIALVATGNELVMPGETPGPDQIIASNGFGLAAMLTEHGAVCRMIPIARDTPQSLQMALDLCDGADLIVTIGGASVGDHDIVKDVVSERGLNMAFHKVAMRPGKPLLAGMLNDVPLIGLPGNPVSSMVCGHIFIRPTINLMLGLGGQALSRELAQLGENLAANGPREHYMRAKIGIEYSRLTAHPFDRQDSALLSVLSRSNGFVVRPPNDPAKKVGDLVEVIRI